MMIALLRNTEKKVVVGKEPTGREFLFVYVCVAGRSLSLLLSDKVQQVKVVNLRAIYQRRRRSTKEKRN